MTLGTAPVTVMVKGRASPSSGVRLVSESMTVQVSVTADLTRVGVPDRVRVRAL